MPIDKMPIKIALVFFGHSSVINVGAVTNIPPRPNPLKKRQITTPHQLGILPARIVNKP